MYGGGSEKKKKNVTVGRHEKIRGDEKYLWRRAGGLSSIIGHGGVPVFGELDVGEGRQPAIKKWITD